MEHALAQLALLARRKTADRAQQQRQQSGEYLGRLRRQPRVHDLPRLVTVRQQCAAALRRPSSQCAPSILIAMLCQDAGAAPGQQRMRELAVCTGIQCLEPGRLMRFILQQANRLLGHAIHTAGRCRRATRPSTTRRNAGVSAACALP